VPDKRVKVDLLKTFKNPTKLNILMLLAENDSMTVTQMSKLVSTSRANLYHFVSEMVHDGLLLKPEVKVKGNYVEKYYRLNVEVFSGADIEEQHKRNRPLAPEEQREQLQSRYLSLSTYFRMHAEQISKADDATMARISDLKQREKTIIAYLTLTNEGYEYALGELKRLVNTIVERWGSKKDSPAGKNKMVLFAFPEVGEKTGR